MTMTGRVIMLTAVTLQFSVSSATEPFTQDTHTRHFLKTFFKHSTSPRFESVIEFAIDENADTPPLKYKKHGMKVSPTGNYGLSFQRFGLNYFVSPAGLRIRRTEPDSFLDLYRINGEDMYPVAVLASLGPEGVICDAYWRSPQVVAILSLVEKTGNIVFIDLEKKSKATYKAPAEHYKGYKLDADVFSLYYGHVFKAEYRELFKELKDE